MSSNAASSDPTTIILCGVAKGTPLFELMSSALPSGVLIPEESALEPNSTWRAQMARSGLRWWDESSSELPRPSVPNTIRLDLFGGLRHGNGDQIWRLVDGTGRPALAPFAFLETVHRRPFVATLRLIGEETSVVEPELLGEAILSSRMAYGELLATLARAAARLVNNALTSSSAPRRVASRRRSVGSEVGSAHAGSLGLWTAWLRTQRARWHDRLFQEDWAVGVCRKTIPEFFSTLDKSTSPGTLEVSAEYLEPIEWLEAEGVDGYLADPFPHPTRADRMLCEVFTNDTGRGIIASAHVGKDVTSTMSAVDLGFDCHLSYPYLWLEDGRLYCLPESGAARTTRIFELVGEEEKATEVALVSDRYAMADPSLFRMGGYYWIAYTDTDIGLHDNLCLLYSTSLQGPWQPHRDNPVKWDVRSSRPGGAPFAHEGILYRPAQNCASTYGAGLAINKILACDPESYREELVAMIMPAPRDRYPAGLHTLSPDVLGRRFLIDGKRYRLNARAIMRKLVRRTIKAMSR